MANTRNESLTKIKETLVAWIPYIATFLILLCFGLSFIGPYFTVKNPEGEKIAYTLSELLGDKAGAGPRVTAFLYVLYIALPLIAIACIFLGIKFKNARMIALMILLLVGTASIITKDVFIYAVCNNTGEDYSFKTVHFSAVLGTISYFLSAAILLLSESNKDDFSVFDIAEMGMAVGTAVLLNFIKFFEMPTGGSVNLQMLPLFLLALRRGPLKGFIGVGIVFGLITCLTDGYGFATFPFDYLLGFGSAAIAGFFSPLIIGEDQRNYNLKGEIFLFVACVLSTSLRFVAGTISSMVIYGYDFVSAALYNLGYVFVSGGIAMVIIMALYGPLARVNHYFPVKKPAFSREEEKEKPEE